MDPAALAPALTLLGFALTASTRSWTVLKGAEGVTEMRSGDPPMMKKSQTFIRCLKPPWTAAVTQDSERPTRV